MNIRPLRPMPLWTRIGIFMLKTPTKAFLANHLTFSQLQDAPFYVLQ